MCACMCVSRVRVFAFVCVCVLVIFYLCVYASVCAQPSQRVEYAVCRSNVGELDQKMSGEYQRGSTEAPNGGTFEM
jgi:uncharacterized protein